MSNSQLIKDRRIQKKTLLALFSLFALLWVGHFYFFRQLGLYEDDYALISPAFGWDNQDLLNYLRWTLTWPQGRPGQYFFTGTLSMIAGQLGGLHTAFVIAFIIQATNASLFFLTESRIRIGLVLRCAVFWFLSCGHHPALPDACLCLTYLSNVLVGCQLGLSHWLQVSAICTKPCRALNL